MFKQMVSFAVGFSLVSQPLLAAEIGEISKFRCEETVASAPSDLTIETLSIKKNMLSNPTEIINIKDKNSKNVKLDQVVNQEREVLFGWEQTDGYPKLVVYFNNSALSIKAYPSDYRSERAFIDYTIDNATTVMPGLYFAAKFSPEKLAEARDFLNVLKSMEQTFGSYNHIVTNEQKTANLDRLLKFFFLQPTEGSQKLKFNSIEAIKTILIGDMSKSEIKDRLAAVKRGEATSRLAQARMGEVMTAVTTMAAIGLGFYFVGSVLKELERSGLFMF